MFWIRIVLESGFELLSPLAASAAAWPQVVYDPGATKWPKAGCDGLCLYVDGKLAAHAGSVVAKADGQSSTAFLESIVDKFGAADKDTIVVDCTASDSTVPALISAMANDAKSAADLVPSPYSSGT